MTSPVWIILVLCYVLIGSWLWFQVRRKTGEDCGGAIGLVASILLWPAILVAVLLD